MWTRRDWHEFFHTMRHRWERYRPPRPVYLSPAARLRPAEGFSLTELDDAGISVAQAEFLGLPVDVARIGSYAPNVSTLRDFLRTARARTDR